MEGHFWPLLLAVVAASGFWEFLKWIVSNHSKKLSNEQKLLLGIAHDRIWYLGSQYCKRGGVTRSEFDNLERFAKPYLEMGGNGTGKKIWEAVEKLQFISDAEAERRDAKTKARVIAEGKEQVN